MLTSSTTDNEDTYVCFDVNYYTFYIAVYSFFVYGFFLSVFLILINSLFPIALRLLLSEFKLQLPLVIHCISTTFWVFSFFGYIWHILLQICLLGTVHKNF